MTTKAMKISRSRSGNAGGPMGNARAATSVTTPRMPAHDATVISRQPTGSAASLRLRRSRSSRVATGKIHRNRMTITAAVIEQRLPDQHVEGSLDVQGKCPQFQSHDRE